MKAQKPYEIKPCKLKPCRLRVVSPIDTTQVKAPWINLRSAKQLTGLTESILRTLPTKRFGCSDYTDVKALNKFILG